MIDLFDLMNEKFTVEIAELDEKTLEIQFQIKNKDYEVFTSINLQQLNNLKENAQKILNLLME